MTPFVESQRFRQPWILGLVLLLGIGALGPILIGLFQQLVLHRPFGDRPMPDSALILTSAFAVAVVGGVIWLVLACELRVETGADALSIRFRPFLRRSIPYSDIRSAEAVTYRPLLDYGGWGIRYGSKGIAYNVSGNRGVRLELSDGKRLLIGSQHPDELAAAIEERRHAGSG